MAPLRILIAEDEAIIAMLLGEVLRGQGHNICATVATEQEAVTVASIEHPDLIIIDAGLGRGSGMAAIAAINAQHPTPHLYVTGNPRRVRESEPDAIVLEKPFHEHDLFAAMERALTQPSNAMPA